MAITPTRIILKHSFNPGSKPDPNALGAGEIAFNAEDETLFWLDNNGSLKTIQLNLEAAVSAELGDLSSTLFFNSAEIVNGELIFTNDNGLNINVGSVIGPEGPGFKILDFVNYANQLPTTTSNPPLPFSRRVSGTAYAALIGNDSGDSLQDYENQVPAENAHVFIYNVDLDNWTDLGPLVGTQGPAGPIGPEGPIGPQGNKGDPGPPGLSGTEATSIDFGTVRWATQEEVWEADDLDPTNNDVVRAKHLLLKRNLFTDSVSVYGGPNNDGGIRIHPDGQVLFSLNNQNITPSAFNLNSENNLTDVDNVIPEGYFSIRRKDFDLLLDVNIDGSITTKILGGGGGGGGGGTQLLSISGNDLSISEGNTISLPVAIQSHTELTNVVAEEHIDWTIDQSTNSPPYVIDENNLPPIGTPDQTLSIVGDDITISGTGGNTITVPLDTKVTNEKDVSGLWRGTQAEYDVLTPNPNVLYVITS